MAQGIGARLHDHDLNWQCGSSDCDFCDLGPRSGESRAMWLARLKARLRGPMVEDALNGRGRSLAVCPACTRLYALGLPCLTCTDPLATVTGVA